MATVQYSSTLIAACTVAAGASAISNQRTFGSNVLCQAINVFVDLNSSGFSGTPTGGRQTLDVAIRPIALDGSGAYDGGPDFYQQRQILGDAAHALLYRFPFPGGSPKLFQVAVINRTDKATAASGLSARIEYVTVAA
jgi:hypothetical protein